jgi:type IV secretion system protein VirB2/type IV secretion system protein PtlA
MKAKINTTTKALFVKAFFLILALLAAEPALAEEADRSEGGGGAAGGLDKVNTFVENVLVVLRGASIGIVTIAIMWAGYKFLFKHADIAECGKILAGGLLIGGAAELAGYLLS